MQGTTHGGFLEDRAPLLRQLVEAAEADAGLVGKVFGPYRICSLLEHGGMGSVWLAERIDGLFKRQVALKLVHPRRQVVPLLSALLASGRYSRA